MRRARVLVLALACCGAASTLQAQPPGATSRRDPGFLTRYDFHLGIDLLADDDDRFTWDGRYGGNFDLVDYGAGRVTLRGDYEVLLGNELRAFDPNQSVYVLEATASYRAAAAELAGVFHHTSRHLSDRAKTFAIDWNMIGVQALRRHEVRGVRLDGRARLLVAIARSFVDYRWQLEAGSAATRALRGRVRARADGQLTLIGVTGRIHDRGTLAGGRLEGGVRIDGERAALDLFVAIERRIDAYPVDLAGRTWLLAGFRVTGP